MPTPTSCALLQSPTPGVTCVATTFTKQSDGSALTVQSEMASASTSRLVQSAISMAQRGMVLGKNGGGGKGGGCGGGGWLGGDGSDGGAGKLGGGEEGVGSEGGEKGGTGGVAGAILQ